MNRRKESMPHSDREVPSGTEDVKPLELCKEDRRKLYGLLEADVPVRLRRIEIAVYAVLATAAARLVGGLPVEHLPAAAFHLIFG
jgi:hypothetical protein